MFQSINLVGGKVDFLDPSDFVGADQSKLLTNRIVGVDDGVGRFYSKIRVLSHNKLLLFAERTLLCFTMLIRL